MISKFLYSTILLGFVYIFFSTTQLPRLFYQSFVAPAAAQQLAPVGTTNQQQKIKRAATREASPTKQVIMPTSQTPAQLGFMFALGLLNLFICYKLLRWVYRVFLRTPLRLLVAAFKFLIVKPYRFLTTPKVIARYEFMRPIPTSTAGSVIIR